MLYDKEFDMFIDEMYLSLLEEWWENVLLSDYPDHHYW